LEILIKLEEGIYKVQKTKNTRYSDGSNLQKLKDKSKVPLPISELSRKTVHKGCSQLLD